MSGSQQSKICFIGTSHAPTILKEAARQKGFEITEDPSQAEVVFISEDCPTDGQGNRDVTKIHRLLDATFSNAILVLTSQVSPGFTRSLGKRIYHQAETLRIKDALHRALHPEMHIVGCSDPNADLPGPYQSYLEAFGCPILKVTFEEAEFSKIAINVMLAGQVEMANMVSMAAAKLNIPWGTIENILRHDHRMAHNYLHPGDWKASKHLLRDWVTCASLIS